MKCSKDLDQDHLHNVYQPPCLLIRYAFALIIFCSFPTPSSSLIYLCLAAPQGGTMRVRHAWILSASTLVLRRSRAYISHHSAPYPTNLYEDVIILCHGPLTTHQRLLPAPAYCSLPFPLIVSTTFYLDFSWECGCRLSTYDGREFPLYQNSSACTIHEGSGHIDTVAGVFATVWMGHWAQMCVVTCYLPL